MSEYKENTVGWWLSQLKEPLRGEMFGRLRRGETTHNCDTLSNALFYATSPSSFDSHYRLSYLLGIVMFYDGDARQELDHRADGWDMAKECAPDNWLKPKDGGEDKAIVDSPEKPKNWIDQELWKWHTDMVKGGVEYADAERGKVKLVADSPAREIEAHEHDEFNSEGLLPNEIPGMMTSKGELISHGLGILGASQKFQVEVVEIPERAVVGYEEPKPIDTIEKKHEIRIQNLEARVMQQQADLDATVETLRKVIDLLDKTMVKVTTLEFINDQKK